MMASRLDTSFMACRGVIRLLGISIEVICESLVIGGAKFSVPLTFLAIYLFSE